VAQLYVTRHGDAVLLALASEMSITTRKPKLEVLVGTLKPDPTSPTPTAQTTSTNTYISH